MSREVPSISQFRKAVDLIPYRRDSIIVKLLYLGCARCSEISSYVQPWEKQRGARALGKHLTWQLDKYPLEGGKYENVLLLHVGVSKRKKKTRRKDASEEEQVYFKTVALPCSYEPWCLDLLTWIREHGGSLEALQFHMTRQNIYRIVREQLNINPHKLRHFRASHLFSFYGFSPEEVMLVGGWTFKSTFQGLGSSMLDIYVHTSWQGYFLKLLKPVT